MCTTPIDQWVPDSNVRTYMWLSAATPVVISHSNDNISFICLELQVHFEFCKPSVGPGWHNLQHVTYNFQTMN